MQQWIRICDITKPHINGRGLAISHNELVNTGNNHPQFDGVTWKDLLMNQKLSFCNGAIYTAATHNDNVE